MIEGWLSGLTTMAGSPTADLYLGNAWGASGANGTVLQRPAPTVFLSRNTRVVMRHTGGSRPLPRRDRTVYVIDDDVEAGVEDPTLPGLYREKLRRLELPWLRRMMYEADVVATGSSELAHKLGCHGQVRVLTPCWSEQFPALDHHAGTTWIEVAFLGSGVHRADLASVLPVLDRLLADEPAMRLHLSVRHRLPKVLARHPRVIRLPSGSWSRYRQGLRDRRFHIALYPLLETPFNRARSPNKLIEHAIVGAAPLYSDWWQDGQRAAAAGAGLAVPDGYDAWRSALRRLIRDPAERLALAGGAQRLARRLNDPAGQRAFWSALL